VAPLRAALHAGVVTHLVIDELTAHAFADEDRAVSDVRRGR
jgi:DNA-binding transcriptional regulator LsrR (DeoR family)